MYVVHNVDAHTLLSMKLGFVNEQSNNLSKTALHRENVGKTSYNAVFLYIATAQLSCTRRLGSNHLV